VGPKYELGRVVAAAKDGDLLLVGSRAREIVLNYVDGLLEADTFARGLVAALVPEHFQETVALEPPYAGEFDVYICPLSEALMSKHGLAHVGSWYVKLKLTERDDDSVLVVSMHPSERAAPRRRKP
jgi:hypothetical protein